MYDRWYPADGQVPAVVARLRDLAGGGPVLELGIGTGRLALPLAQRGVPVWGIDASPDMLRQLATKSSTTITMVLGDMAALRLPAGAPEFSLVFAAFNTFFLLISERAQRACLKRCRELLAAHGRLALELYSPAPTAPGHRRWRDQTTLADGTRRSRTYERSPYDDRLLIGHTGDRPWALRPLPIDELDAMAADAGFTLESRWQNWQGEHYFAHRSQHVSIWQPNNDSVDTPSTSVITVGRLSSPGGEVLVYEPDGHGALADGGGDALDGAAADVAGGEDAGGAGF